MRKLKFILAFMLVFIYFGSNVSAQEVTQPNDQNLGDIDPYYWNNPPEEGVVQIDNHDYLGLNVWKELS